jgi:hypothetical protein
VVCAGAQGTMPALTRSTSLSRAELAGRGAVDVTVIVGAQSSNTVQVRIGQ